jgi:hypothetical protein
VRAAGGGPVPYSEVWEEFCERQRAQGGEVSTNLSRSSTLPRLNSMTGGGMYEQQLITVVGQTSRRQVVVSRSRRWTTTRARRRLHLLLARDVETGHHRSLNRRRRPACDGDSPVSASAVRNAYALDEYRKGRVLRAGAEVARAARMD